MCTTCSECVRRYVCCCQKKACVTYTPAHALVPKAPVTKCTQHSLQKMHIYIYTHTHAHAYICTRTHTCIYDTAQHAETLILRLTTYAQICIHIHIHMYIHVYKYIYTYTCIYIHTCMSVHIHTYTHIRTHTQHVHMHTRKHAWKKSAAATARGADADARSSARLFRSTQSTTFGTSNAGTSL